MSRAKAARALVTNQSEVRTYTVDLTHPSTDYSPADYSSQGYGSFAPVCRASGWNYDTQSDNGSTVKQQGSGSPTRTPPSWPQ